MVFAVVYRGHRVRHRLKGNRRSNQWPVFFSASCYLVTGMGNARVREQVATDAEGKRELAPSTQVRALKFEGVCALIAREGRELGYVPAEAVVTLQ